MRSRVRSLAQLPRRFKAATPTNKAVIRFMGASLVPSLSNDITNYVMAKHALDFRSLRNRPKSIGRENPPLRAEADACTVT